MKIQTNGDDCRESGVGETCRQQFEAWIVSLPRYTAGDIRKRADGQYEYMETEWCYRAWQASRAAIEITPPKSIDSREALSKGFMVDYSNGYGDAMDAYEERLKEAGITVKE